MVNFTLRERFLLIGSRIWCCYSYQYLKRSVSVFLTLNVISKWAVSAYRQGHEGISGSVCLWRTYRTSTTTKKPENENNNLSIGNPNIILYTNTTEKIKERKLKHLQRAVKGNKRRGKENSRLFEHKAYSLTDILLIYQFWTLPTILHSSSSSWLAGVSECLLLEGDNLVLTAWKRFTLQLQRSHMRRGLTAMFRLQSLHNWLQSSF